MGEAKRRGTYEQRKQAAIERDKQRQAGQMEVGRRIGIRGGARNHNMFLASMLAIAAQSGFTVDLEN